MRSLKSIVLTGAVAAFTMAGAVSQEAHAGPILAMGNSITNGGLEFRVLDCYPTNLCESAQFNPSGSHGFIIHHNDGMSTALVSGDDDITVMFGIKAIGKLISGVSLSATFGELSLQGTPGVGEIVDDGYSGLANLLADAFDPFDSVDFAGVAYNGDFDYNIAVTKDIAALDGSIYSVSQNFNVPEPATYAMFGFGLLAFFAFGKRNAQPARARRAA